MSEERKVLMEVRRGKQSIINDLVIFVTYIAIFIVLMIVLDIPDTLKTIIADAGGVPLQIIIAGILFFAMTAYFIYAFIIRSILCYKTNKICVTNLGVEFHKGLNGKKLTFVPYDEVDSLYIVTPYATIRPDNREIILEDTYGRRFKREGVKSPAITYLLINDEIASVIGIDRIKPYIKGGVEYSFTALKNFRQLGQEKRIKREIQFDDDYSNIEVNKDEERFTDSGNEEEEVKEDKKKK